MDSHTIHLFKRSLPFTDTHKNYLAFKNIFLQDTAITFLYSPIHFPFIFQSNSPYPVCDLRLALSAFLSPLTN